MRSHRGIPVRPVRPPYTIGGRTRVQILYAPVWIRTWGVVYGSSRRFSVRLVACRTGRTGVGIRVYGPYGVRVRPGWCTGSYGRWRTDCTGLDVQIGSRTDGIAVRAVHLYVVDSRTWFPYGRPVRVCSYVVVLGRPPYGDVWAYGPHTVRGCTTYPPFDPYGQMCTGRGVRIDPYGVRTVRAYGDS